MHRVFPVGVETVQSILEGVLAGGAQLTKTQILWPNVSVSRSLSCRDTHMCGLPHTQVFFASTFFFVRGKKNCKEAEHERNQINMAHQYHGPLCSYEKGVGAF